MQLDDPDRQSIRELAFLNLRQLERRRRTERRRLGSVGRLREEPDTCENDDDAQEEVFFINDSDIASSWLSVIWFLARRLIQRADRREETYRAAARMSEGDSARYRARSSLNQSGSPVFV